MSGGRAGRSLTSTLPAFSAGFVLFAGVAWPGSVSAGTQAAKPPPEVDPYTRGEPAALERLGYRSFGPFRFGPVPTGEVVSRLGDVPILWVETEHFRIGSNLGEYKLSESWEVELRRAELEPLRARLEGFPAKPKKLDPWLRLHLAAARLERLHADFRARLGLVEPVVGVEGGGGPTLGVPEKLAVLLTQKKSTLARFTREFCGFERSDSALAYLQEQGVLFYGLSLETLEPGSDSDLHYAMVHGVVHNLVCAIDGFPRRPPPWWMSGLALWFARAAEPRIQIYARPGHEALPPDQLADWQPLVRGRVEAKAALGWPEMFARASWIDQPFGDNVVLWSRIDYFLQQEGLATKLARELAAPGDSIDSARAVAVAAGLELEAVDADWRAWVLASYRKKR